MFIDFFLVERTARQQRGEQFTANVKSDQKPDFENEIQLSVGV